MINTGTHSLNRESRGIEKYKKHLANMTAKSVFALFSTLSILIWSSCGNDMKNKSYSSAETLQIINNTRDSVIASFLKDETFCVIRTNHQEGFVCDTYRQGFPTYYDSLTKIKHDEFLSENLNTRYLVKDTCVVAIQTVKIIHPSSNWQGQTPWQQPYIYCFKRIDHQSKNHCAGK